MFILFIIKIDQIIPLPCIISWYLVGVWFNLETFVVFLVWDLLWDKYNSKKYNVENPILKIIHWISMIWQNFNFHCSAINCKLVSQSVSIISIVISLCDFIFTGVASQSIPASEVLVHLSDITVILCFPQHNHSLLSNDIRNNIASLHGRFTNIIIIYHFLPPSDFQRGNSYLL